MTAAPAPDVTDRTDASDAEFAQRIAGYPADVAHAAMVEQVARAMWDADHEHQHGTRRRWDDAREDEPDHYRRLAAAAIAALPAHPAVVAVKRVEALHVSDGDPHDPECVACRAECLYCEGDHPWPCPTMVALAPQPADAEGTGR